MCDALGHQSGVLSQAGSLGLKREVYAGCVNWEVLGKTWHLRLWEETSPRERVWMETGEGPAEVLAFG